MYLQIIWRFGVLSVSVKTPNWNLLSLVDVPGVKLNFIKIHSSLFPRHRKQETSVRHLVPRVTEPEAVEVHQQLPLHVLAVVMERRNEMSGDIVINFPFISFTELVPRSCPHRSYRRMVSDIFASLRSCHPATVQEICDNPSPAGMLSLFLKSGDEVKRWRIGRGLSPWVGNVTRSVQMFCCVHRCCWRHSQTLGTGFQKCDICWPFDLSFEGSNYFFSSP